MIFVPETMADGGEYALTVYNNDLGVVKENRNYTFVKGTQTLSHVGVATRIDPTSVRFSAQSGGISVLEQNYRYDLVNSRKVLERYLDHDISIVLKGGMLAEGKLQSVDGDIVIANKNGGLDIVKIDAIERYSLSGVPENFVTRPTLVWKVDSQKAGVKEAEISYLTAGMSWHAEYSAVIDDDEKSLELSSWVSVENNSGASYDNAKLKLVAGDVHRARNTMLGRGGVQTKSVVLESAAPVVERGLFEYHLYELKERTNIKNAEVKQVSLFNPSRAKIEKKYIFDSQANNNKVMVKLSFENSEKTGLGIPLPKGVVRVFKKDTDGALEMIGEDNIDHTPKNETVELRLGNAFDIVAKRTVEDREKVSRSVRDETVAVTIRNRREEAVEVIVNEHLYGTWNITTSSHAFDKHDAYTARFPVSVPPDGEATLRYTARYR